MSRAREVITQILPEPQASLLNGILLGDDSGLPADGQVVEGESDMNEAMITGESLPVRKAPGVKVIGGSIVGDSSLRVRVSAIGEQTALAGIMRLVREAQQSKSRTQILADRAAGWLFYLSLGVALASTVMWTVAIGFDLFTLQRMVAVLVIACPHALALAAAVEADSEHAIAHAFRRDARGALAGWQRQKSLDDVRPDAIAGKSTPPRDATQAQRYLERGAVSGRVQGFEPTTPTYCICIYSVHSYRYVGMPFQDATLFVVLRFCWKTMSDTISINALIHKFKPIHKSDYK